MAFMPIFGHKNIKPTLRVSLSFFFTIFLFSLVDTSVVNIKTDMDFIKGIISELTLGFVSAVLVQIIFSAVQIIGDLIGMATTLSMAKMFDPTTATSQGVISRFLYMILLVLYFQTGMYEATLVMVGSSINMIHLGEFNIANYNLIKIAATEVTNMFLFAFTFSFPLFFIGFVLDVYYGYGTKSMPAFSPFIVTFQIKFTLIFIFLMLGLDVFATTIQDYFINKLS